MTRRATVGRITFEIVESLPNLGKNQLIDLVTRRRVLRGGEVAERRVDDRTHNGQASQQPFIRKNPTETLVFFQRVGGDLLQVREFLLSSANGILEAAEL